MPLRTRTLLLCFAPVAVLLALSFWMTQRLVQTRVHEGLRTSLRENQRAIALVRSQSDLQSSKLLKVVGENPTLKAGLQLLLAEPASSVARYTVEDQLRELGEHMGFDFLLVSAPGGAPLAGMVREGTASAGDQLIPIDTSLLDTTRNGLTLFGGSTFQIGSVPMDQGDENLGALVVGQRFNFSGFTTPVVLIRNGRVLQSTVPGMALSEVEAQLAKCDGVSECDVRLRGARWISLPMESRTFGDGYVLRSLQNVDAAAAPVQAVLRNVFLIASIGAGLLTLLCSMASARSIVGPIAEVVSHLRSVGDTGMLPEFTGRPSSIREIRDLTESFNRAAVSVREARDGLQGAYVEFIGSLANALDARDRYTAGHSGRVGDLACATAAALGLAPAELERIRVGALLHDIGKIGISDVILQKPGKLTKEEFAEVARHPRIGRRILEGVRGFAPYLDAVELHHENWDGTGYPHGRVGEQTPIEARIIHVSDVYDALTTDRPYRPGMSHDRAIDILRCNAGTHFDPGIVAAFIQLLQESRAPDTVLAEMELAGKA